MTNAMTLRRLVSAVALLYPAMLLVAIYGAWLATWLVLGHPPRAMHDDPAATLGPVYMASGVVLGLMPAAAVAAAFVIICCVLRSGRLRPTGLPVALFIAGLWVGAITLLRWDPFGVVYWWFD